MDFFYPNFNNDFWRVMGLIHFRDAGHFVTPGRKAFDRERIESFCLSRGYAFYDTACQVRRLKNNASDAFLEVLEAADVGALLTAMPECRRIATTGSKASEEMLDIFRTAGAAEVAVPPAGEMSPVRAWGRQLEWWRMPSTSRAYPLPLAQKAEKYRKILIP